MPVSEHPRKRQYIVNAQGRRKAVVLPLKEYEQLMEDLHDLAVIAQRRDEGTMELEELQERLRRDGII
jgi:PHD/YefM family antitoxin component YafN of YafNO toxin-antitoxin module